MTLDLAILNIILGGSRAMNAGQISGFLPAFTAVEATVADVENRLTVLSREGYVTGTGTKDKGMVWLLTPEGNLRVHQAR